MRMAVEKMSILHGTISVQPSVNANSKSASTVPIFEDQTVFLYCEKHDTSLGYRRQHTRYAFHVFEQAHRL